jgi:hypothetical protein
MTKRMKLIARYIMIAFFMYLSYHVTTHSWLSSVKDLDPMTINVVFVSVFGALTMVLKAHFDTVPTDDPVVPKPVPYVAPPVPEQPQYPSNGIEDDIIIDDVKIDKVN